MSSLEELASREEISEDRRVELIKKILVDSFVEVHESGKSELPSTTGGCTSSVVLQLGEKIYIANCGDSKSVIATFHEETGDISVAYTSRDDTPDLEDERARIEKAGGSVLDINGSHRVVLYNEAGEPYGGLAVSRALGDYDLSDAGVIPDPIGDVIDLKDIGVGGEGVFAILATDGLMDFVERSDLLCRVVEGLYVDEEPHLLTKLEDLITHSKEGWFDECGDEYRDDITIAASKLAI